MPQNTIFTQELSLATMIFEISVREWVKIAMLPKIRPKCPWVFWAPLYLTRYYLSYYLPYQDVCVVKEVHKEVFSQTSHYYIDKSVPVEIDHSNSSCKTTSGTRVAYFPYPH